MPTLFQCLLNATSIEFTENRLSRIIYHFKTRTKAVIRPTLATGFDFDQLLAFCLPSRSADFAIMEAFFPHSPLPVSNSIEVAAFQTESCAQGFIEINSEIDLGVETLKLRFNSDSNLDSSLATLTWKTLRL